MLRQFDFFDISLVVLPGYVHQVHLACIKVLAHIQLLAEEVRVFDFDERLDVSVSQVNQVYAVFVASHNVRQLLEMVGEQWL